MTTDERFRAIYRAKVLRWRYGHTLSEIARRLEVSRATVLRWTDPELAERDRAASRNWKKRHPEARKRHEADAAGSCRDCGRPTSRGYERCRECLLEAVHERSKLRRKAMIELWSSGLSLAEVARQLGTTPGTVGVTLSKLRSAGEPVPYARERRAGVGRRPSVHTDPEGDRGADC